MELINAEFLNSSAQLDNNFFCAFGFYRYFDECFKLSFIRTNEKRFENRSEVTLNGIMNLSARMILCCLFAKCDELFQDVFKPEG